MHCIIKFIQLHTPPHNTSSYPPAVILQNNCHFLTTSVQACFLQHRWLCPLSLAPGFEKSYIHLHLHLSFPERPQKNHLIYKDLPSVILIPSLLEAMPGCWMCERVFAVVQDAEVIVTWTYQGFAGETWLCLHLAWKLLNRMRLGKFWVQN